MPIACRPKFGADNDMRSDTPAPATRKSCLAWVPCGNIDTGWDVVKGGKRARSRGKCFKGISRLLRYESDRACR